MLFPILIHHVLRAPNTSFRSARLGNITNQMLGTLGAHLFLQEFKTLQIEKTDVTCITDYAIMLLSKALFLDDQIEQTVGERGSLIDEIVKTYEVALNPKDYAIPWRFQIKGRDGKQLNVNGIFIPMLLHKYRYPKVGGRPLSDALISISKGKDVIFPRVLVGLKQLKAEYEACLGFLLLYLPFRQVCWRCRNVNYSPRVK